MLRRSVFPLTTFLLLFVTALATSAGPKPSQELTRLGLLLRIAEFLIEEIDLLLHDFVPILQRAQQGFLLSYLLLQSFILGFEGRVAWVAAARREAQNDGCRPGSGGMSLRDLLGHSSVPHGDVVDYPSFCRLVHNGRQLCTSQN